MAFLKELAFSFSFLTQFLMTGFFASQIIVSQGTYEETSNVAPLTVETEPKNFGSVAKKANAGNLRSTYLQRKIDLTVQKAAIIKMQTRLAGELRHSIGKTPSDSPRLGALERQLVLPKTTKRLKIRERAAGLPPII